MWVLYAAFICIGLLNKLTPLWTNVVDFDTVLLLHWESMGVQFTLPNKLLTKQTMDNAISVYSHNWSTFLGLVCLHLLEKENMTVSSLNFDLVSCVTQMWFGELSVPHHLAKLAYTTLSPFRHDFFHPVEPLAFLRTRSSRLSKDQRRSLTTASMTFYFQSNRL